jgi:hypothetical protein
LPTNKDVYVNGVKTKLKKKKKLPKSVDWQAIVKEKQKDAGE